MANIYPVAYFDPDSNCKCHFKFTEVWLKKRQDYKQNREKMKRWRKEHKLLGEVFNSLRDDPTIDNFLHCEAVVRRNIPTYKETLYKFYEGLLYEYNIINKPNDSNEQQHSATGQVPCANGTSPP
ncbi:hypothetical protein FACS189456_2940 [Bacteroidia bacterium]|nr:hypothetical protein FACS189456_2940 [Bacteroidia bacterium]